MEHQIKEEGILEIKALTVTRGIFKQMIEVPQKAYLDYKELENKNPWDTANWIGYVVDDADMWFIFQAGGTLKKIRDMELWFAMRSPEHSQPTVELRKSLRQVFLK